MFARLQKIAAGVDIDDEGESLNEVDTVLRRVGISLTDTTGNFRNMGDVLDEVGAKWSTFSNLEQAQIATAIAGTRQRENFLVLMSQYTQALKYSETALNSEGTALEKFGAYEDSVEAKTQALTAAFEGMINNLTNSEGMKALLDIGKWLINFADKAGILKTVITALIGQGVIKLFTMLPTLTIQFQAQGAAINGLVSNYESLINQMFGLTSSVTTLKQSLSAYPNALGAPLKTLQPTLLAIVAAYSLIKGAINSYIEKQKEARELTIQAGQEFVSLNSKITNWSQSLTSLNKTLESANITSREYLTTHKQIANIKEQVIQAFEEQTNAVYDYTKSIEENLEVLRDARFAKWQNENAQDYEQVLKYIKGETTDWANNLDIIINHPFKSMAAGLAGMGGAIVDAFEFDKSKSWSQELGQYWLQDELNERATAYRKYLQQNAEFIAQGQYNEQYSALVNSRKQYEDAVLKMDEAIANGDAGMAQESQKAAEEAYNTFKNAAQEIQNIEFDNPYVAQYFNKIIQGFHTESIDTKVRLTFTSTESDYKKMAQDTITNIRDIFDSFNVPLEDQNIGTLKEYIQVIRESGEGSDEAKESLAFLDKVAQSFGVDLDVLLDSLGRVGFYTKSWSDQIKDSADTLASLNEHLKKDASAIKTIEAAEKEYNENKAISLDTLQSLIDLGDEYLATLLDENGQLKINALNTQALAKARLEAAKAELISSLYSYLKTLGVESSQVRTLTEDYKNLSKAKITSIFAEHYKLPDASGAGLGTGGAQQEKLATKNPQAARAQKAIQHVEATYATAQLYDAAIANIDKITTTGSSGGGGRSSGGGGGGSSEDTWLQAYEYELAELDHLRAMDKINTKQYYNELQKLTNKYFRGRSKYHDKERENLEKLWDLYKQILEEEKDRYEKTLSYVDGVIDKKIEELEKEKELLKKKNEEKEKELKLEQLEDNLRKAKQRTMRTYYEGVGWIWESDAEAIADAQKELDDYRADMAVDEIDKQIDAWEEYKKQWDDVAKNFEIAQNKIVASETLGYDIENQILAQRLDIWNNWQAQYIKILQQIENATTQFNNNQAAQFQNSLDLAQSTNPTYTPTTSSTTVRGATYAASGSPYVGKGGLTNVDEHGKELIIRKPAQGRYTFLQHGDGILNASLTRNIMALANNPELAIRNVLGHILANGTEAINNAQTQIVNISNITLPNVENATQFVRQLQLISQNH